MNIIALLALGGTTYHLEVRAVPDPCFATGAACGWLSTGLNACNSGTQAQQDYCICNAVQAGTSAQYSACLSCENTNNATIAADLSDLKTATCSNVLSVSTSTSKPTSTYYIDSLCTSACGRIGSALNACSNDKCFCPTLMADASQCSACWATINATEAHLIASISTECSTELANTGAGASASITGFGSPSVVVITETVVPSILIPQAPSTSSGTSSSSSGLSSGAIAGIAVGAFAGVAILTAAGFLFFRREKRDIPPQSQPTYPAPYAGDYPHDIKPPGPEERPGTGIRYLDPDAPNETVGEIPSGRLQE